MEITLTTPLPRGKYKGVLFKDIKDHFYICWILNNWSDTFSDDIIKSYSYPAYMAKLNGYGINTGIGVTLDSGWDNN